MGREARNLLFAGQITEHTVYIVIHIIYIHTNIHKHVMHLLNRHQGNCKQQQNDDMVGIKHQKCHNRQPVSVHFDWVWASSISVTHVSSTRCSPALCWPVGLKCGCNGLRCDVVWPTWVPFVHFPFHVTRNEPGAALNSLPPWDCLAGQVGWCKDAELLDGLKVRNCAVGNSTTAQHYSTGSFSVRKPRTLRCIRCHSSSSHLNSSSMFN